MDQYDFSSLVKRCPDLGQHIFKNQYGTLTIDFADPAAVKMLNKALLIARYGISHWDIPDGYLCPPVPGRALYIEKIAELLASSSNGTVPRGDTVRILDIGTGANCIYPIIGHAQYGWNFTGSDIDRTALRSAEAIIQKNHCLQGHITLRHQKNREHILEGIVLPDDFFDAVICNPPFHASAAEAQAGSMRKWKNLGKETGRKKPMLNFGGTNNELWCSGGEAAFASTMAAESFLYKKSCRWFTILIAKESNIPAVKHAIKKTEPADIRIIDMKLGNKVSRIAAWNYFS